MHVLNETEYPAGTHASQSVQAHLSVCPATAVAEGLCACQLIIKFVWPEILQLRQGVAGRA